MSLSNIFACGPVTLLHQPLLENWGWREYAIIVELIKKVSSSYFAGPQAVCGKFGLGMRLGWGRVPASVHTPYA